METKEGGGESVYSKILSFKGERRRESCQEHLLSIFSRAHSKNSKKIPKAATQASPVLELGCILPMRLPRAKLLLESKGRSWQLKEDLKEDFNSEGRRVKENPTPVVIVGQRTMIIVVPSRGQTATSMGVIFWIWQQIKKQARPKRTKSKDASKVESRTSTTILPSRGLPSAGLPPQCPPLPL